MAETDEQRNKALGYIEHCILCGTEHHGQFGDGYRHECKAKVSPEIADLAYKLATVEATCDHFCCGKSAHVCMAERFYVEVVLDAQRLAREDEREIWVKALEAEGVQVENFNPVEIMNVWAARLRAGLPWTQAEKERFSESRQPGGAK